MTSPEKLNQSGKPAALFTFSSLKGFATYLLEEKLQEAGALNLKLAKQHKLPLLQQLAHLSEDDLVALSLKGQEYFYRQLLSDSAMERALDKLEAWKQDKLGDIRREKVKVEDLVLSYSIQKQVCLHFLPSYTEDCHQIIQLMQELEGFYAQLQHHAMAIYVNIQQERIHEKNQFLTSLIENSIDGILAFDKQMKVTEWNPALEKSLGIKKENILGKPLMDFFPALENTRVIQAFELALKGHHIHYPSGSFPSRTGVFEINTAPLYDENNKISGGHGLIHDISQRVEAENRLKEHQEELQVANEELTEQREELQTANEELTEQREEIHVANEELTEQREELQAANEELTEQREELQATNEELTEQGEEIQNLNEELRGNVLKLEEAQAIAHLGSFEYTLSNDQVSWSAEMKRIFAIPEQETDINYERYLELLHPEDRQRVDGTVQEAIAQGQAYSFEHRIMRKDGSVRWLLSNGKALFSNGKVSKLQGTALDITERKLAQLKLQEEQLFIQKITQTSPDVITVFDLEKKTNIFANRELDMLLGYSREELQELRAGKDFLQKLIHPDHLAEGLQFLSDFAQYTGTEPKEIEYKVKRKAGDYIWVSARYSVFKTNKKGFPIQIISVTRDIHQRKLAEEKTRQSNFKLQEANEELMRTEELLKEANTDLEEQVLKRTAELQNKNIELTRINSDLDNFVYTASHDLKVPIVNLEGLLILLNKKLQEKLDEKDQQLLAMMETSIDRFKNTIQDLSDLTRTQKDLDEDNSALISLPELIQDIQSDISQLIADNTALVKLDLTVKEISFDRKNLRSILYNLLTNAIKYSSADRSPAIIIRTLQADNGILLSVQDNGDGIPENQQEKIFSLFKRLHKNKDGSGMGLYIVKRIVDNNGGRIEVESKVGTGTTFKIYLQNG